MKLGLIARADRTGLGHQTLEMYRAMKPHKTLVVDLTGINRQMGKETTLNEDWYPDATFKPFPLSAQAIDEFLEDLDVVFTCETPYNHYLFDAARQRGVKTVRQYNYEFLDYLHDPHLPKPDLLLAPSRWHLEEVIKKGTLWNTEVRYLPVPIATDRFTPKVRKTGKRFIHIAGHKTAGDRNGTEIVKAAMSLTQAELIIKEPDEGKEYWENYDGDVLVIPRRYGGLSLQVQEACAAGMVPILSEGDPYDGIGVSVSSSPSESLMTRPGLSLPTRSVDPKDLAKRIDELNGSDITELSKKSIKWADERSWEKMKPVYNSLLEDLVAN